MKTKAVASAAALLMAGTGLGVLATSAPASADTAGWEIQYNVETALAGSGIKVVNVNCSSTSKAPTGGGWSQGDTGQLDVVESQPTSTGWTARFRRGASDTDVAAFVICVNKP